MLASLQHSRASLWKTLTIPGSQGTVRWTNCRSFVTSDGGDDGSSSVLARVRGVKDILPTAGESRQYQAVEETLAQIARLHRYSEIRTPILEHTGVFEKSLGQAAELVSQQMFQFRDTGGKDLVLRPEGTAAVLRAMHDAGLLRASVVETSAAPPVQTGETLANNSERYQRVYYTGPMFRRERPQRGRYRQFQQFGVELYGSQSPAADVEVISMAAQGLQRLGVLDRTQVRVQNTMISFF